MPTKLKLPPPVRETGRTGGRPATRAGGRAALLGRRRALRRRHRALARVLAVSRSDFLKRFTDTDRAHWLRTAEILTATMKDEG